MITCNTFSSIDIRASLLPLNYIRTMCDFILLMLDYILKENRFRSICTSSYIKKRKHFIFMMKTFIYFAFVNSTTCCRFFWPVNLYYFDIKFISFVTLSKMRLKRCLSSQLSEVNGENGIHEKPIWSYNSSLSQGWNTLLVWFSPVVSIRSWWHNRELKMLNTSDQITHGKLIE